MIKIITQLLVAMGILALATISTFANAGTCTMTGANVESVTQEEGEHLFIKFKGGEIQQDCCTNPSEAAFLKSSNEKFFIAAALTALSSGATMDAIVDDEGCVAGSPPILTNLTIHKTQ